MGNLRAKHGLDQHQFKGETMKDTASQSITLLANRSDHSVLLIASGFAVVGATLDIVSGFFIRGGSISMLWPVWIPLCFLIIPPVHYLCRRIRQLEDRLDELTRERPKESP